MKGSTSCLLSHKEGPMKKIKYKTEIDINVFSLKQDKSESPNVSTPPRHNLPVYIIILHEP